MTTGTPDSLPLRSVLYVPAVNLRALRKAATLTCDAVIIDLEDSVDPERKGEARRAAAAALNAGMFAGKLAVLRINGLDTRDAPADLAISARADAVLLPKVESPVDLQRAEAGLDQIAPGTRPALWAMIETPRAILNVAAIAAEADRPDSRLACLVLGTNDIAKETRAHMTKSRLALLAWMSQCVLAARAYGLTVLDGVFNDLKDMDGYASECRQGRALGFDGKTLIHPSQIAAANALFGPSDEEIAEARAVVSAFADPANAGRGVIAVNGRMTERLHLEMAEKTLRFAART